ncbi:MAG TPA: Crp/Fnr family transcriptional regulator [Bryobacteraceae bacterium]|nr:Crp/Fnr family transcriptional regulator [Bryobacteraceae bacterium]
MKKTYDHPNDALNYLPRRPLVEFAKGQVIYSGRCDSLYLVAAGRVKVSSTAADGCEAIIKIVPPEGLFGAACLVGQEVRERAVALDKVQLMAWRRDEIEQQIEKEPKLGLALMEELVVSAMEMQDRIQAMAGCKTPERVMLSLLQLAASLGKQTPDGALQMPSLTHHLIAEHVGTSREIVSSQMSRLRRLGLVRYTRKEISIYCEAMEDALRTRGITPRAPAPTLAAGRPS